MSRRFDGKPETERDTRFFDQREAGYTGWLDQDANPVMTRTDPKTGQARGFETRGYSGRGTPDETRANALGKKRRR